MSNLNFSDFSKKMEEYANGRVILYSGTNFSPYETYQGSLEPQKCFTDSVKHIHVASSLTESYFSRENVDLIQQELIKRIYNQTGHVISRQSDMNLQIIMRSIYLQYGKNNPYNVEGQINELNQMVVKWSVPRIMSEIEQYNYYLNDISTLPVPIQQPVSMSSAGTKSLPFQPMM